MKKRLVIVALIVMMLFVTACGKSNKGEAESAAGSGDNGSSNSGVETPADGDEGEVTEYLNCGMTFITPSSYIENQDKVHIYDYGGEYDAGLYAVVFDIYPGSYEELMRMTEDEFQKAEELAATPLIVIRASEDWDFDSLNEWLQLEEGDPKLEEIKKEGGDTFYALKDDRINEELPDELKPIFESIIKEMFDVENNLIIFEPEAAVDAIEGEDISGQKLTFTTTDVDGNEVKSEDIFSQHKYTMINCWASWCGPCIAELPEIEELSKTFAEHDCGVIGILTDGSSATGLADGKEILKEAGVTYLNIIDWDGFYDQLPIQAYPTTYFVDSNGVIVGETVIGAMPKKYSNIMMSLIG